MKRFLIVAASILLPLIASAQEQEQEPQADSTLTNLADSVYMAEYDFSEVEVLPEGNVKGMLLINKDIQYELEGAVDNMYNFKYERAEKQFKSLRRRYPEHPMAYFLLGLSNWWKIIPTNIQTMKYDDLFFAYMDTTVQKAEKLYDKDNKNFEAAFFLAAAYGFEARLHSERSNWRKATVASKRALEFMEKAKSGNGLSPEFLFGEALFNYYSIWIHENYKLLRPVLAFFPSGDKRLGVKQLRHVANNGFYTATEAKFFLMRIYANEEGNQMEALKVAHDLNTRYPDNAYFHRTYARLLFVQGHFTMAERVSQNILDKLNEQMPGYEAISGRYASYVLAYINQNKYRDFSKAKQHYRQVIKFTELTGEKNSGYYLNSFLNLARIAKEEKDMKEAKRYYTIVINNSDKKSANFKEARTFLKENKKI